MITMGQRIYVARSMKGYTQAGLASETGFNQAQISQWENNKSVPTSRQRARLEEALGSLQDLAPQIQEFVERYPVSIRDISKEADVVAPTIYNILNGKVTSPHPETVAKIEKALEKLRERHRDDAEDFEDTSYEAPAKDDEPEEPAWIAQVGMGKDGAVGKNIKEIRVFDPHDEKHVSKLPSGPGVYLIYAGNNDIALDFASKRNKPIDPDKLKMVGTPEYIGTARNLKNRIKQHRVAGDKGEKWWWRKGFIDLAICIEIDTDGKLHEELETLLIKLMSPQININKQGVKI